MKRQVGRRSRPWRVAALSTALALVAVGPIDARDHTVRALANNTFVPSNLTVEVGDTVTFVNGGGFHNVVADDNAWSCAEGCSDSGGSGAPSAAPWRATRTFPTVGLFGYYCDVHGVPGSGMIGKVNVVVADEPGRIELAADRIEVGEGAGSATVLVRRVGGIGGAVSVAYTTSPGTASTADFTPASGILSWPAGNADVRAFTIKLTNDAVAEETETIRVALSAPTGGATLGRASAVVAIRDDDGALLPGVLRFAAPLAAGAEGETVRLDVVRTGGTLGAVAVSYAMESGSALPGSDYAATAGTIAFAPGESGAKAIDVPIVADGALEPAESFRVVLTSPTGGAILGEPASTVVVVAPSPPVAGALSSAEVECDRSRLAGFLSRAAVSAPRSPMLPNLSVALSATGDFSGLATSGIGPLGPGPAASEAALAFSVNVEESPLLRNPARPQLASVSLTRNELNSDLVAAGDARELRVVVVPTLAARPPLGSGLAIDNLAGTAGRAADAKPGRGLAPILSSCHPPLAPRDAHLFRVLQKLVRGELPGAAVAGAASAEIAIFRGEAPDSVRIDLRPVAPDGTGFGRLAVLLEVTYTAGGELASGTLRLLDRCVEGQISGCTDVAAEAAIVLIKPVFSGSPPVAIRVGTSGPTSAVVDFAALLGETTWRRPAS